MTPEPLTLSPEDGLAGDVETEDTLDLANDVISLGRIRHIPIVEDGRLVGLLSERDLIGAAANQIFGLKQRSRSALLKSVRVKSIMHKKVVTVAPDTPIAEAAQMMADKEIGCVPVVSNGSLVAS